MKKIRLFALLCALLMCFTVVLASCIDPDDGGGEEGERVVTDKWWTDEGELSLSSSGEVKYPNVTIKLTTVVSGEDLPTFKVLIKQFNDQYKGKIYIDCEDLTQTGFESTVATRISNNSNVPDLIMSHQKGHQYFVDNKLIQPFNKELMEQSNNVIDMKDYSKGLSQYSSLGYKDELFSIPCDAQSMVVFYNKKLLAEIGKELPTNHEELLDVCQAFVDAKGTSPIAWPAANQNGHFYNYVFTTAIMQNGGELYDNTTKKANWTEGDNKQAFIDAIQSIRDLIDNEGTKYAPFNDSTSDEASIADFVKNRALFYVYLPWRISSLEEQYKTTNSLKTVEEAREVIGTASIANWFALDKDSADADKIFVDSHFFAMSKTVTNVYKKAAIMEFIKWFTQNVEVCQTWASTGHITACTVVGNSDDYRNYIYCRDYVNNFYPNIDNLVSMGLTTHYNTVLDKVKKLGIETLKDPKANVANKLAIIQKEFNDRLELN